MSSFYARQIVTIKQPWWAGNPLRSRIGDKFKVLEVIPVPPEEISYHPSTHEGGAGHHQLVVIELDGINHTLSGWWFED